MLDYTQILRNAELPNYVAPVSLTELGARQFSRGMPISDTWPTAMLEGYRQAERIAADAETAAYLQEAAELDAITASDPNYKRWVAEGSPKPAWGWSNMEFDGITTRPVNWPAI